MMLKILCGLEGVPERSGAVTVVCLTVCIPFTSSSLGVDMLDRLLSL